MQHRDRITIQKVISEMQVGIDLLGSTDLPEFLDNEIQVIPLFEKVISLFKRSCS